MRVNQPQGTAGREYRQKPGCHSAFQFRRYRARLFLFTLDNQFVMYQINQLRVIR